MAFRVFIEENNRRIR